MINRQKMYEKLISSSMLSDEEFYALREAIKVCSCEDECVGVDCPLNSVKAGDGVDCCTLFAQYAGTLTECRIKIAAFSTPESAVANNLKDLADNAIKICNEIKIKTKRETPMDIVVSHHNGKTLYNCKNCGKPLFIQASTQYCECCGQKLKFEG